MAEYVFPPGLLVLSQAPPPAVMEMATNRPLTITPISMAPSAEKALAFDVAGAR